MALKDGQNSLEVQMASKVQLILEQPMSDVTTGLVNKDFQGDFFKVGDTVSIMKPDISSVKVELGSLVDDGTTINAAYNVTGGAHALADNADARLDATDLKFTKSTMQINKSAKYAFIVSDIINEEGKWNYQSGGLDMTAHQIRRGHNVEVCNLLLNDTTLKANATADGMGAAAPIEITNADDLYEKVIIPLFARLYDAGAITQDGQVTFGSNPQQEKQTYGKIYLPTKLYTKLLTSKYLTDRSTVNADTKVETGKIKTILGLDIAVEPSLVTRVADVAGNFDQVTVADAAAGTFAVIAGTRNAVTHAGKVLPPEGFRSHTRFGTEYHGMEIYGQQISSVDSAAIAYVTLA